MPTARLQATFSPTDIDRENGVIKGVRVMELGKLATFEGEDGKPKSVQISADHISALMNNAGNRAIPMHWTHGWAEDGGDGLASKVGMLKNFRRDADGNLLGDAHLAPGAHRESALWSAEHDPSNIMLSAVFDYSKRDPFCIPKDFRACDFVERGAATTALLEETKTDMPDDDLISQIADACKDPHKMAAFKALMKSVQGEMDDNEAAAMESDAGVTDDDKKKDDDQKPALMRAFLRSHRAFKRQLAAAKPEAFDKTAMLAEVKTLVQAETTALLGKSGFIGHATGTEGGDEYTAKLAEYTKTAKSPQAALTLMLRENPKLYPIHEAKTRERIALLAGR